MISSTFTCCTSWYEDFEEPVDLQCLEYVVTGLRGVDKGGMGVGDSLEQPLEGAVGEPGICVHKEKQKQKECHGLI